MFSKIIKLYLLLILFLTIAVFGEPNISPVNLEALKPTTTLINLSSSGISNEIPFTTVTDQPPPFGTVVQQWTLNMGCSYGIPDSNDAGTSQILSPADGLDSGSVIISRAIIRNYGTNNVNNFYTRF